MDNLSILKKVHSLYDPQTAFGNIEIINLLKKIRVPNKLGLFEVDAFAEEVHVITYAWTCVDCGYYHKEDNELTSIDEGDRILRACRKCGAKHEVTVSFDI